MPKRVGYLWIVYHVFLGICIAQDLPCTVTHEGRRTRYNVPEFNETGCYYQWTNGTKFPLATHETPMDKQVEMKSHQTLLTNVCSEVIYYNRDCLTEGRREATCTTNCSGQVSAFLQTGEAIAHYHWIAPIVVPLLLLGLGLWLGFKNRTFRCGNLFYTSVKTQNNMPDVEERACTL
ncbi:uncharacterized protein LOC114571879 isoform X2 [Perca flavescens]|uniref:uncharacterized protein LOC114571879 isoform X2 n=1 Tax=Perca flavescens TaxID=8167 RepID=UPI00106F073B|nr:uncharacterized protein LOC114571879 isoform X2 [Perca flavescens]